MSLQFTKSASLPAEAGCETRKRFLRKNDMATNFRRCTSSHGGVGVLRHVTIERTHLGRKCSQTVSADSGEALRFKPMVDELRVATYSP